MDLSKLQIQARQRSPWEAVDLGFVVARAWYKPLFLVWAIPTIALYLVLFLAFWDKPWIASLAVWWLKPLFDRLPLHIASRRLFGEDVSVSATLKSMLPLFKPQWFLSLTWRRLSPTRSHDLPVTCLENLKGSQRSRRLSVLHMTSGTPAMWLTVLCVHVEMFFWMAILALAFYFVPLNVEMNILPWLVEGELWFQRVSNTLYVVCCTLIAPFYCMSGFMLYISRRIDLEAWDLEIKFRNLVQTRADKSATAASSRASARSAALVMMMVFVGVMFSGGTNEAYAQDELGEPREYLSLEESQEVAEAVLAGEEFSNTRELSRWRFKETDDGESEMPDWLQALLDWWRSLWEWDGESNERDSSGLSGFFSGLNLLAKICLIAVAVAAVAWVIYMVVRSASDVGLFASRNKNQVEAPEVLFGLDVRRQSRPKDVLNRVRELCKQGDFRAALALFYGALLSRLIHDYNYRFYDGHTEWECAQIVSESAERPLNKLMLDATGLWQQLAYAGSLPQPQNLEQLCNDWEVVFSD